MDFNYRYWIIQTVAMMLTAFFLPGLTVSGPIPALATVIALAFVNAHVWDAALFFQIPDTLNSHVLTLLIANAVIFWIVVKILPGIEISGIFPALAAPIVFTLTSIAIQRYEPMIDWQKVFATAESAVSSVKNAVQANAPTPQTVPLESTHSHVSR